MTSVIHINKRTLFCRAAGERAIERNGKPTASKTRSGICRLNRFIGRDHDQSVELKRFLGT